MDTVRALRSLLLVLTLTLAMTFAPGVPAIAERTTTDARAVRITTPQLILRAMRDGRITRARAHLLLAYSIARPARLPRAFRATELAEGTTTLLRLVRFAKSRAPGAARVGALIGLDRHAGSDTDQRKDTSASCASSTETLPTALSTPHFRISYDPSRIGGGLAVQDYAAALERAWATEVHELGWARPPTSTPGGRYPVRVVKLPGLYGYVSSVGTFAGSVGDNPSTAWTESDAHASCMVLNANLSGFASRPKVALDATAAHEFNHAIQFGYGALTGPDIPDDVFVEGGATWIEDEVVDGANDNYRYLWPSYYESMGAYASSPYGYWVVLRALTEPFGTGPGGGEDVLQGFWEAIGRGDAKNMDALRAGIAPTGMSLGAAFHTAAISLRSLRTCGVDHYGPPYCLQEAKAYLAAAGPPPIHGAIKKVGANYQGGVHDDFGLNWVSLPTGAAYRVRLSNTAAGGQLRASLVCDDGDRLRVTPMPEVVGPGSATIVDVFDATACVTARAVITNQKQNGPNPTTSAPRTYGLATSPS